MDEHEQWERWRNWAEGQQRSQQEGAREAYYDWKERQKVRLSIVGPAPHQQLRGRDEEGSLWAMAFIHDEHQPVPCHICHQPILGGYMRVRDKVLVCPEHIERIEPESADLSTTPST